MTVGLRPDGQFRRKIFVRIRDDERDFLWNEWRSDLDISDRSPLGHIVNAASLEKALLWQAQQAAFYSPMLPFARGPALDNLVLFRNLQRFGDTRATGQVTLSPIDEGEVIPAGFSMEHVGSGLIARTTQDAIGTSRGTADAPVEVQTAGPLGNFAEGSSFRADLDVSNVATQRENTFAGTFDSWSAISPSADPTHWQMVLTPFVAHPIGVRKVGILVRNGTANRETFHLRLAFLDHATGDTLTRTGLRVLTLDPGEQRALEFTGIELDVSQLDAFDVAVVNDNLSDVDIEVAVQSNSGSPSGAWFANAVEQTDTDALMSIFSSIQGDFTGGRNAESDAELRGRYLRELHIGGAARDDAILSRVFDVEGLISARVRSNADPAAWKVWMQEVVRDGVDIDQASVNPPGSLEVLAWGGPEQDIVDAIGKSKGSGTPTIGNVVGFHTDAYNQVHEIFISRPTFVDLHATVLLKRNEEFRGDMEERVADQIVRYIGGVDRNDIIWAGRGIEERVSHSVLLSRIHRTRGIDDADIWLGTDPDNLLHESFVPPDRTVPRIRRENIEFGILE